MHDRVITISGASKTFSVTGWRIGTIVAPAGVTDAIRKVHDFLTVGAPAPLQEGVAAALEELGPEYYQDLAASYRRRREVLHAGLVRVGFQCAPPAGAYYILADFSNLSHRPDDEFAARLTADVGVASVPGSSFYSDPAAGRTLTRFAFCKTEEMLAEAVRRLAGVRD